MDLDSIQGLFLYQKAAPQSSHFRLYIGEEPHL